ncbi:hypothetical protein AB0J83_42125 [Actinoplanes sp. NPDC049596]|uniref:hypothetical protein n=1 Tax=unclassified Actinoplanes TaxID=2626549 RepID=UPI003430EF3B
MAEQAPEPRPSNTAGGMAVITAALMVGMAQVGATPAALNRARTVSSARPRR